jgi:DNA-binding FrmR family transcriptional regulator
MKSSSQRINNIIGQLEGVQKMMETKKDCISVLTQLKAVKAAVTSVMDSVVEDQMVNCMKSMNEADRKLFSKMKNYVRSN